MVSNHPLLFVKTDSRPINTLIKALTALLFTAVTSSTGYSNEAQNQKPESLKSPEAPIRFVTEHWPPYNFLNDSGEVIGLATEKVQELLGELALEVEIEVFHWAKAIQLAEFEENVFLYSIYRTQSREKRFQWICPLMMTQIVAFYKLASRPDVEIKNIQDAKKYRISVMNEDLTMRMLLDTGFEKGVHFDTTLDELTNVRKLLHGRVDLIVQEENALQYRLELLNSRRSHLTRLEPLGKEKADTLCIATSLNTDKALVEKMRTVLSQ